MYAIIKKVFIRLLTGLVNGSDQTKCVSLSNQMNHSVRSCKNRKYVASIMDNSAITSDEIIESYDKETETIQTNFNEKKAAGKTQNFYILLVFLP